MILLLTHAQPTLDRYAHPHLGRLVTPRHFPRVGETADAGIPWAADNDCFNGFDERAYVWMLERLADLPGCLFALAPDVVGDAAATLDLFRDWGPDVATYGLPVGLAAQDGLRPEQVPWPQVDALFVGGTTGWKIGPEAAELVREARRRGRWVHMGRVNSLRRIRYAKSIGVQSFDGTKYARFVDARLPLGLAAASRPATLRLIA